LGQQWTEREEHTPAGGGGEENQQIPRRGLFENGKIPKHGYRKEPNGRQKKGQTKWYNKKQGGKKKAPCKKGWPPWGKPKKLKKKKKNLEQGQNGKEKKS